MYLSAYRDCKLTRRIRLLSVGTPSRLGGIPPGPDARSGQHVYLWHGTHFLDYITLAPPRPTKREPHLKNCGQQK